MIREEGQTTLLAVGLALVVFSVAGIAVDGTRAFLMRRSLQTVADAAVLAGAAELDEARYYRSGGDEVALDVVAARDAVESTIHRRGGRIEGTLAVSRDRVYLVLRGAVPTSFLATLGISRLPVAVEAEAEPVTATP